MRRAFSFLFSFFLLTYCPLFLWSTPVSLSNLRHLRNVPLGEETGVVINSRPFFVEGEKTAYNPSIVKKGDSSYLIAYRYDATWTPQGFTGVKIGILSTDRQFHPISHNTFLTLQTDHATDPRLFWHDKELYVLYSNLTLWGPPYECCLALGEINPTSLHVEQDANLLFKKGPREKNWVPFSYQTPEGKNELYCLYEMNPYTIIRVENPATGKISDTPLIDPTVKQKVVEWEKKWGKIRGGTPAELINGEYLTFFHSSFKEGPFYWYVFGAATFDKDPPFRLKKISRYPILFKNMYQTPVEARHNQIVRAAFPGGYVQENEVLHVLIGENDSAIKIITLDINKLFDSLQSVCSDGL